MRRNLQRAGRTRRHSQIHPLLVDIPFLSLLLLPRRSAWVASSPERRPLELLADGVTPAISTMVLISLSISIERMHRDFGILCMALSLVLLVARSTLMEWSHLKIQDALAQTKDRLFALSLHDDLTGVSNRRAFQACLRETWGTVRGGQDTPLSMLLIDIDHFKMINDRLGHEAGDDCLRQVAATLVRSLPEADHGPAHGLFRYGGEEFVILLPDTANDRACEIAETLRHAVSGEAIANRTPLGEHVTISVGVATAKARYQTSEELVRAADQALYQAKRAGRNRVSREVEPPWAG